SIGIKASELGTGSGAAGGAIIGFARAENEISTMHGGPFRWNEQFDVIDFLTIAARNPLPHQCLANSPGEVHECFDVFLSQLLSVVANQKKPVASPGHITDDRAMTGNVHANIVGMSIAGHVGHSHFALVMEMRLDDTDRRFDPMIAGLNLS